jgi:uncharacterized protein
MTGPDRAGGASGRPTGHGDPAWPHRQLDVVALRRAGWRPTPFRDFVLKVHQRCNLACDYCYVYTMADQSWRDRPAVMQPAVWRAAAGRIGEHVRAHRLDEIRVILHGGEPLLARPSLPALISDVRAAVPAATRIHTLIQTNGVLLTERVLGMLLHHRVRVGVSVDGAAADNDRHRRHADGRSSHRAVSRALDLLRSARFRSAYAGVLCTIDPATDPVSCYEALLGHEPPMIDFLFPHASWARPPGDGAPLAGAPYGRWLAAVFDRWYAATPKETSVRLFEELISGLFGGASRTEQVGLSPVAAVVVQTDGTVEQSDSLKSTYAGAAATGLDVFRHSLDGALSHPGVVARQIGRAALCDTCRRCAVHATCGAGHYAHRYRPVDGFRNPSVYCADLRLLIEHVRARLAADIARRREALV